MLFYAYIIFLHRHLTAYSVFFSLLQDKSIIDIISDPDGMYAVKP